VLIDLIGFRRYGHSEVEDPTVTQPLLYEKIVKHPLAWEIYAKRLGLDATTVEEMKKASTAGLSESHEKGRAYERRPVFWKLPKFWGRYQGGDYDPAYEVPTALPMEKLQHIAERITRAPDGFSVHPKINKLLQQRAEMAAGKRRVDWGMAEALAFGSLVTEGIPIRLTGQDSRRGTFNQRHAALIDTRTNADYVPLAQHRRRPGEVHRARQPAQRSGGAAVSSTATAASFPMRWCCGRRSSAISPTAPRSSSTSSCVPARTNGIC
jgi:2-oxoglutarate dehydrogenase E1 component